MKIKHISFIDESGDPSFYASGNRCIVGTDGFKPLLLIGIVKVNDKKRYARSFSRFMNKLISDPLYNSLPCLKDPKGWYLHASYDNLEVRVKFVEFLRELGGFEFYCVIGRKRLEIFHQRHNRNETEFYFDLPHAFDKSAGLIGKIPFIRFCFPPEIITHNRN